MSAAFQKKICNLFQIVFTFAQSLIYNPFSHEKVPGRSCPILGLRNKHTSSLFHFNSSIPIFFHHANVVADEGNLCLT